MSAIVTNARNRIAYNVAWSLGERGVEVTTSDFVPKSMSFYSRYSTHHFVYPSPYREPAAFIDCMVSWIDRLGTKVLIPVLEETFLIAKHVERFAGRVSMVLPTYDQILLAHNKDRWAETAKKLEIPTPRNVPIESLRRGAASAADMRYPVFIKPKQGGGGWGMLEVSTPDELNRLLESPLFHDLPWERFFIQEKITGETHCVAMLFNHGAIRAKVAYRQLREFPIRGGQATARESLRSPLAEDNLQRLLEFLAWHGVCQADFVVDAASGIPYLIDLNPRLWGSLAQARASGVDFPYLIYRMAMDGDVAPIATFEAGVVTRWLGGELRAFWPLLKASESRKAFLRNFFLPAKRARLYDDFRLSDPLPFVAWHLDVAARALRTRSTRSVSHDSLEGIWE